MRETIQHLITATLVAAAILTVAWIVFLALVGAAAFRVAFP